MKARDPFALPVAASDLVRLEETLRAIVLSGEPFVDEIATHLIEAGGKRLRPTLTLAAATLEGDPVSEESILGGVAVELVHLASLYHDDVMDEAVRRRNVVSVNGRWGNLLAVVAGDYLLARSAEIATSLGTEIAATIAATLARLCQGQIAEARSVYRIDRSVGEYLSAIADKTGALMGTACRVGALTTGLERRETETLTAFGERLGFVFQIRDDILDIIATEEESGKPPGQDLAEGIYTLPVQRALVDRRLGPELRRLLGRPLDHEDVELARALVAESDGIVESQDVARRYAIEAGEIARHLDDGVVARSLRGLGMRLVDDLDDSMRALAS
ncbi:MAG TPA: polyprenyl synthetase family protein [Acidimicrobiales bacterium]|nr:polyprenyl synthetase family protein [Acidimicrobiales bacterium]